MRYLITLLLLCVSVAVADSTKITPSLQEFSQQIRESYEKKDAEWILKHTDTNGVPAEITSAQSQFLKFFFGFGNLEVVSVETFEFAAYKPSAAPGEFQGRKLRFVGKPTHWVVLKAKSPKAESSGESASKNDIKLEFAVFQKNGRWSLAGATYAD
jgi:hypothetical protein